MFGGERFLHIIGNISLAHDMKAALQEADDLEPDKPVVRDAKGREILSPEEKARKEAKQREISAKVCTSIPLSITIAKRSRKPPSGKSASSNSLRTSSANWAFSRSPPPAQMTRTLRAVSGQYASLKQSTHLRASFFQNRTNGWTGS